MTAGLCFWTGLTTLLSTLPLYVQDLGGSEQQVGLVMGSFAIGLILARPHLGTRADQQSRKQVLIIGLVVGGLAPLGYLLTYIVPDLAIAPQLPKLSILMLFALRAFHGVSVAAFTTAYTAYVVDQANPLQRIKVLGYMSLVTPIGLGVGPVLGGLIQRTLGYGPLFWISSALAWIGLACVLTLTEVRRTYSPSTQPQGKGRSLTIFLEPRLRILALVMFCAGSTFGTLSTFMPLHIKQMGLSFNPGYYYLFAAGASFTMRLVTGKVAQRFGKGRFITVSILCYFFSMILLWQGSDRVALVLSGLLEGSAGGLLIPVVSAIVADRSLDHERGKVFSVCLGGFDLGIALAGPIFGSFVPSIGLQNVFLGASFISMAALAIFMFYGNQSVGRSVKFALGTEPDYYAFPQMKQQ